MRLRNKNSQPVWSFLNWHAQHSQIDLEQVIDLMVQNCEVRVEREQIYRQLNELENPLPRRHLVTEMINNIEDQELVDLLSTLERFSEEEENQNLLHNQEISSRFSRSKRPYWASRLLIHNQRGEKLLHLLPSVVSDSEAFLRLKM